MERSHRRVLRWILVVPSIYAAWAIALLVGYGLTSMEEALCPARYQVSGLCIAPWAAGVEKAILGFSVCLAAVLFVIFPALIAPAKRRLVAWAAYAVGAGLGCALGVQAGEYLALACALTAGLLAVAGVNRWAASGEGSQ